jgi:hypothetical protein
MFNARSQDSLNLWLEGNRLHPYASNKENTNRFGPHHSHHPINFNLENFGRWFEDPNQFLNCYDVYQDPINSDEQCINALARGVIILSTLLILAGVYNWLLFAIGLIIFIIILGVIILPTAADASQSKLITRTI